MIKNPLIVLLAALCFSSFVSCSSTDSIKKGSKWDRTNLESSSKEVRPVRTTAYTHTESDHIAYSNKTAIGTNLKYYSGVRSAAADWSKYPVGTRFQIVGNKQIYEIDDYGSALVGKNTIDLYKPTRGKMNAWGARDVRIKIIKWGSYERSKEILKDRTAYSHVRKMYDALKEKA
ncbi:MAG: 3D (Asp-Asp-Asp) domain-containing protein [Verrucomicrobiales bacterium]|jgi:3D (Asp-Asp-Asp) domain-containing protein